MAYHIRYRRADGEGTHTFLTNLGRGEAVRIKTQLFERDRAVTMCWVLDDDGNMLGDALTREPSIQTA